MMKILLDSLEKSEVMRIRKEHLALSCAIGRPLGIVEADPAAKRLVPITDLVEQVLNDIYGGRVVSSGEQVEDGYTQNEFREPIIMFLRSKDDNLLLLTAGLLTTYSGSETVDPVWSLTYKIRRPCYLRVHFTRLGTGESQCCSSR